MRRIVATKLIAEVLSRQWFKFIELNHQIISLLLFIFESYTHLAREGSVHA